MKKLLFSTFIVIAISMLVPGHAWSRGGGGGGGGRNGGGNRGNTNGDENQQPTPKPTATPTPAPAPVQGTISNVTPFAVSIKATPQSTEQTFKIASNTTITLNGIPVTIAALKPGMLATITPYAASALDALYAASVVATLPAAAPVATPPIASNPQHPSSSSAQPAASPAAQQPPGSTYSPFGKSMPY